MASKIFVTYNRSSKYEESTALRLQTISNLYGFTIQLPYRFLNSNEITDETKTRVNNSDFVVAFCTNRLTNLLKQELIYSISKGKKLIVIYDESKGKKIHFGDNPNVREVFVNFEHTDEALHTIAKFLRENNKSSSTNSSNELNTGLDVALLGIGLGLLAAVLLSKK